MITDVVTALASLPAAEQLPDDLNLLKSMIVELLTTLHQEQRDKEALRHQLNRLLQRLYGPRGERFNPNQPLLFSDMAESQGQDQEPAPAGPEKKKKSQRKCKPHGRRELPKNLPRVPRHHELSLAERICAGCGQTRVEIGIDKSEQLEYRPASLIVIEHFTHKYACRCCSKGHEQTHEQPPGPSQEPVAAGSLELPARHEEPEAAPAARPETTPPRTAQGPARQPWQTEQASMSQHATNPEPEQGPEPAPLAVPAQAATSASEPGPLHEPMASRPAQALMNEHAINPEPERTPPPEPPGPQPPLAGIVVAAPKPAMPIPKGLPGPGLLAHLIVSKYVDHLPLHRLQRVYGRQGLVLPRSTTCDWLAACGQLLQPLYEYMIAVVLQSRVIHTDDTPVKMQEPSHLLSTARLWAYLGDAAHPYNVFDFTVNRKRDGPQRFLETYQGYLQADAFSGYDGLYLPHARAGLAGIIEVACNAHARRKFHEARTSAALGSHQALGYYRQLYELERSAKANQFDDGQRLQMRQDLAVPILDQFQKWLEAQRVEVLPKSPLAEAIGYALNNWTALVRYTEAGFLAIDNNVAEREMKRIAIGRKNWLFVGSAKGGHTAAVLFSFTSTCDRLGVEPWAYLQDVLTRLPTTPPGQLADLLPDRWQAAHLANANNPAASVAATTSPTPSTESAS